MDINDKQLKQLLNELEQVKKLFDEDRPSLRADTIVELIKKTRPDKDE
jgi:hypothetical protein|tara:strand:- start:235 stop:378 length:144 start_codon:yes stop_codon:yes gene_type:complete